MKSAKTFSLRTLALAGALTLSTQVAAEGYGVQIGAYQSVSPQLMEELAEYGRIVQEPYVGLTRIIVTSTGELNDTETLLRNLKNNGFSDAYIKKIGAHAEVNASYTQRKSSHSHDSSSSHSHGSDTHRHIDSDPKWQRLTAEQRSKAVYLDGKLHLKEGSRFIPVE